MRDYYLKDLIRKQSYTPLKNSFLVQKMRRGENKTLLEIHGSGSVRHIWSTWSIPGGDSDVPAPGRVLIRVFIDDELQPSISAPLDELCRAAEATGTQFVPLPAFNYKGAFNFYLPIFFNDGIRVEIEALDEVEEFYAQIDYRTENRFQTESKLVSVRSGNQIQLHYAGHQPSWNHEPSSHSNETIDSGKILEYGAEPTSLHVKGPGVLRKLVFETPSLDDLQLQIYWDDEETPAVDAPLRYLFSDFNNAAMESSAGRSSCYFPMPFRKNARIVLRSLSGRPGRVNVQYSFELQPLPQDILYFHAWFHETEKTLGYAQHPVLQAKGEGVFVGANLFDTGHNHGGGDAALIDAGTQNPHVLHGICGEDYFGFAWHHFGTMTPLTGAPAHERRYRLHLENPYPFHESIQFLFGTFAGQHPKSVAFWYQAPTQPEQSDWLTFDIPWKVLGPAGENSVLPAQVTDAPLSTTVPINQPTLTTERWQDTLMKAGFLDATYQFRHYAMTERGTGFVAGKGKTEVITWVYSPSEREVKTIVGHDDRILIRVNGKPVVDEEARTGFGALLITLPFAAGWNELALTLYNDENVNWRWCGVSLAFDRTHGQGLRFDLQPDAHPTSARH